MRQIVLDTETTGLEPSDGHCIVEIACVELVDRKLSGEHFHGYFNPEREIDMAAFKVHGLTLKFLSDKPRFATACDALMEFVHGTELIIHNATFDLAFLDAELSRVGRGGFIKESGCTVLDTLELARELHPGLQNNLDALCDRYSVDKSVREAHGALVDSELLAHVYLAMTGGQTAFDLDPSAAAGADGEAALALESGLKTPIIAASIEEIIAHERFVKEVLQRDAH